MAAMLDKAQTQKDSYSGTASEIARQLAFAGVAVIWLFRVGGADAAGVRFEPILLWPLAGFTVALLLDILQYVYSSIAWWIFYLQCESKIKAKSLAEDALINTPWWVLIANYVCYFGKLIAIIISYGFLIVHRRCPRTC